MLPPNWFPDELAGELVVLRRHVPENLASFRRWYADPEIARPARYQEGPMRPEEVELSLRPGSWGAPRLRWRSTSARLDA